MIYFSTDYTEGTHPRILQRLAETNMEQTAGYGEDPHCERARALIRAACQDETLDVHFLVGGTQTNFTVISAALRPHQGVISAVTGHINVHETGAVEATGHKVLALPAPEGKLTAEQIRTYVRDHYEDESFEHIVQPGMVYLSNPTELGTIYTKAELTEISAVCKETGLYLFLDGARLGYGLTCRENDLTLPDIAALTDVFYIGGTKVGALFGEAVVISNPALKKDFRYLMKLRGGMLAKGRLLGIQFEVLFEDGLYFEIGRHGAAMAEKLRDALSELGIPCLVDSPTNQLFPVFSNEFIEKLHEEFAFEFYRKVDDAHSSVRFCTSWATKEEAVDQLIERLVRWISPAAAHI